MQDKLWLPGLLKLKYLIDEGFFGKILSVRGEFGYWVFDGVRQACQRPSWNYRKEDGGSIMIDMFCHWRYVIDNLFGEIDSLVAHGSIDLDRRVDEQGNEYECTADDSAYGIFLLKSGATLQFNSSWCTRVRRDDLLTIQVDGTKVRRLPVFASVAYSTTRSRRSRSGTRTSSSRSTSTTLGVDAEQQSLRQRVQGPVGAVPEAPGHRQPFRWGLLEGAKGVQLAELGLESWHEKKWLT